MTRLEAIAAVRAERVRHVSVEGWTADHDDQHDDGEMLRAAVFYYQHAAHPEIPLKMDDDGRPVGWPWDAQWWKPKDRVRNLVRAGALCLAERDRLRRKRYAQSHLQSSHVLWPPHVRQKYDLVIAALAA